MGSCARVTPAELGLEFWVQTSEFVHCLRVSALNDSTEVLHPSFVIIPLGVPCKIAYRGASLAK